VKGETGIDNGRIQSETATSITTLILPLRSGLFIFIQALSVRKGDPAVLVSRAKTYAKMGIVKESLDDVNNVLKEDPENYRVCAAPDLARSLLWPGVRHKLTFVYYCIQTAKDIVKFLSRYGSPIFSFFFDSECRYPIPMGRLIHGV